MSQLHDTRYVDTSTRYVIRMYLVSAGYPDTYVPGITAGGRTFRPWTHTSDDSYMYQLSLVVATATVSFKYNIARRHKHTLSCPAPTPFSCGGVTSHHTYACVSRCVHGFVFFTVCSPAIMVPNALSGGHLKCIPSYKYKNVYIIYM